MTTELEHTHLPRDDEEVRRPDLVRHRELSPAQWERFEGYMGEIFTAFGLNRDTAGGGATPQRFVGARVYAAEGEEGGAPDPTALPPPRQGGAPRGVHQTADGASPRLSLPGRH